MFDAPVTAEVPARPTLFFTVHNHAVHNPQAVAVIGKMRLAFRASHELEGAEIVIFDSLEALDVALANGHSPASAVVLFDGKPARCFSPTFRGRNAAPFPNWSRGATWGIAIGPTLNESRATNCAEQARAWFGKSFDLRVDRRNLPWGNPRQGEAPPTKITLPSGTKEVLERLNAGPDMVSSIAHMEFARRLPRDAKISWLRVPAEPASYPRQTMETYLMAVAAFERACASLTDRPEVARAILSGVCLDPALPHLAECYLHPRAGSVLINEWSVRRPDMHVNGHHLHASENDEMPGGFVDLYHVDRAYGLNQESWKKCLDFLFANGPLIFVVSDGWSATYIDSTRWMVKVLRQQGYDTDMVVTADLNRFAVGSDRVFLDGRLVGTIWRQFPVFETTGMLAALVFAAQDGKVRMVPEFAHFGNKSWFSLFWQRPELFDGIIQSQELAILKRLIPESHLLLPGSWHDSFQMSGRTIHGIEGLLQMQPVDYVDLVLKVTGANDHAARSYGVLVGAARSRDDWTGFIRKRQAVNQPFIVQKRFDTSVERLAVWNIATRAPELFRCKVLLRPWVVGGRLVSSHNCCTPAYTTVVHGMVDMAVQPILYV